MAKNSPEHGEGSFWAKKKEQCPKCHKHSLRVWFNREYCTDQDCKHFAVAGKIVRG